MFLPKDRFPKSFHTRAKNISRPTLSPIHGPRLSMMTMASNWTVTRLPHVGIANQNRRPSRPINPRASVIGIVITRMALAKIGLPAVDKTLTVSGKEKGSRS